MVKIIENKKNFIVDSKPTGCGAKFCRNCNEKKKTNESNDNSYSPPAGIEFTFTACHLPLSQQADGFQLLVDSDSSKHVINSE